jgi:hypothetical protein
VPPLVNTEAKVISIRYAVIILCAALFAPTTHAEALSESSCSVLVTQGQDGEKPTMRDLPGLEILNRHADEPLIITAVDGVTINAVVCWRSEARLAEHDYLVTDAGFPLYVKTDRQDESANRTLVLERSGGSFRVRLLSGPSLTDAEKVEIQHLLALYDTKHQETPDKSPAVAGTRVPQPGPITPNRPNDNPHVIRDRGTFDAAIAPYVAQARKTYGEAKRRFLQGLPSGYVFFVITRLRDSSDHWEQAFIRVQKIQGELITGVISSQLAVVDGLQMGQVYSFKERELVDWLIARPDGSEEGNVVGKFLDSQPR